MEEYRIPNTYTDAFEKMQHRKEVQKFVANEIKRIRRKLMAHHCTAEELASCFDVESLIELCNSKEKSNGRERK